jgi:3-hydroxyacyl-CoA dehydrogenase
VTIYDPDAALLHEAEEAIATRKRHSQGANIPGIRDERDESAPDGLRLGRSLLDAVTNADWIIDATSGDLLHRQRLLEQVERAARLAAIVTCSAPSLSTTDLCARLRRPARVVVAHALDPVEHVLAVEIVPGTLTDPAVLDELRNWLRLLGRLPVVLRKEVPGNATGRIAVAVWRECIRLVLDGVLEVRDVDVLISSGLAARWAAAGPFQTAYLEAGERQTAQLSAEDRGLLTLEGVLQAQIDKHSVFVRTFSQADDVRSPGYNLQVSQIQSATESGIEHPLGLTCDPPFADYGSILIPD